MCCLHSGLLAPIPHISSKCKINTNCLKAVCGIVEDKYIYFHIFLAFQASSKAVEVYRLVDEFVFGDESEALYTYAETHITC